MIGGVWWFASAFWGYGPAAILAVLLTGIVLADYLAARFVPTARRSSEAQRRLLSLDSEQVTLPDKKGTVPIDQVQCVVGFTYRRGDDRATDVVAVLDDGKIEYLFRDYGQSPVLLLTVLGSTIGCDSFNVETDPNWARDWLLRSEGEELLLLSRQDLHGRGYSVYVVHPESE